MKFSARPSLSGPFARVRSLQLVKLRQDIGGDLPLAEFFRNPTVEGMALALSRLEATPGRLETAARLRLKIEALTPEELKVRLAVLRDRREVGAGV